MADKHKACAIEGCNKNAHWEAKGARGWCQAHYSRWVRHGDPLGGRVTPGGVQQWLIDHTDYPSDECLTWPFADRGNGYGAVIFRGLSTSASRAMCILAHGEPPTPLHEAAHSCGKGDQGCTNPRHLGWATKLENEADKHVHGTRHRLDRAKLTRDQADYIRSQYGVVSQAELARRFQVSTTTIRAIHVGKTWRP